MGAFLFHLLRKSIRQYKTRSNQIISQGTGIEWKYVIYTGTKERKFESEMQEQLKISNSKTASASNVSCLQ